MTAPANRDDARLLLSAPSMIAICAIGITQIIAWGTSFYALGVLANPISADTGWSPAIVFGGFTLSVLASSAVSTPAGLAIDRFGARAVMSGGFALLAVTLYWLAQVETIVGYYAAWLGIGIALRLTLYDAAFAAMVEVDPANGRRAIAYLTLFGGFASTFGWPVGHALNAEIGWRDTFLVFAIANLLINMPLAWFGLMLHDRHQQNSDGGPESAAAQSGPASEPLAGRDRTIAMLLFSIVMSANAFVFGVGAIHLVGIIEASGLAVTTAVGLAALKGVAQVGGRVWELAFGRFLSPMMLGRVAIGLLPLALGVLILFAGGYEAALAFVLIFGASNGLVTVVRGAVPLALFGANGYGTILGILATPVLLFNAVSPLAYAGMIEYLGHDAGIWLLLSISILAYAAMEVLAIWYRRRV